MAGQRMTEAPPVTAWRVVAALLAEPLRRAFEDHLDTHGCAERYGFAYCPEAMELFMLLPIGDRVIVAAA